MARKPQSKEVASVAAFNEDGMLLFARRRDTRKWTLPGGHIEEGESAEEGAVRELLEETGLSAESVEVLGHCELKDKNLIVYSFQVTVPKDEYPEEVNDPDEECDEFRWVNPDVIPPEILSNLHSPENVTLQLLGLQEKTLPLKGEEDDLEEPMSKAEPKTKYWRSRDGIRIPSLGSRERAEYENSFKNQVVGVFAQGDHKRIQPITIPTDKASGSNMPVNKDRLSLYTRMLRAGDDVPPVVVRRAGPDSYYLIDGNHRQAAAQATGRKELRAYLLKDSRPSAPKTSGRGLKKSEVGMARIKPMNRHLPFLMHLEFHPHDNEVWVEKNSLVKAQTLESFEKLVKGKKDGLKMYGSTPTPEQKEHVDWSYKNLPNENWATWSIRNHRSNPSAFTPEVKQKLEHYALHPSSDIQNIRFDKSHDLNTGLQTLQDADSLHQLKGRLAEKPESAEKIMDVGDGFEWWDLGKSKCSSEGEAMEHCGNDSSFSEHEDNLLSLRKKHVIAGKTYYEPHVTFVENNGALTEMRGRGNEKPTREYHRAIAELLKKGHIPVGAGFKPEGNFHVDDFSDELYDEVKKENPKISLFRSKENAAPHESLLDLYARNHPVENIDNRFRGVFFHKLAGLDSGGLQKLSDQLNKKLKNIYFNPAKILSEDPELPKNIQPVLASLNDGDVDYNLSNREDLSQELQDRFAQNPDLAHLIVSRPDLSQDAQLALASHGDEFINKKLASRHDLHLDLFEKFAQNPNLHKELADNEGLPSNLHAQVASVAAPETRKRLLQAQWSRLHPDAVKVLAQSLAQKPDSELAVALAQLPSLHPELHSLVASVPGKPLSDFSPEQQESLSLAGIATSDGFVGNQVHSKLAERTDLHPDVFKKLAQNPKLALLLAKNTSLPQELHPVVAAHNDPEANAELAQIASPELLDDLIQLDSPNIKLDSPILHSAASNGNIRPEQLQRLIEMHEKNSDVHFLAARNSGATPEHLKNLIQRNDNGSVVHKWVSKHPNLTPELQVTLARTGNKKVLENLAENTNLHISAARILASDPSMALKLSENKNTPQEIHPIIAAHGNHDANVKLAKRPDLHPELFKKFAEDPQLSYFLADHPNLPPELQTTVARVGSRNNRVLAQREDLTPETFDELAKDSVNLAYFLSRRRNITTNQLKTIINNEKTNSEIRAYIAQKPDIAPEALQHLAEVEASGKSAPGYSEFNDVVLSRVAQNTNASFDTLKFIVSKTKQNHDAHKIAKARLRHAGLWDGNVNKSESLDKNLAGFLTGAALNLMSSNPEASAQAPAAQARPSWSPEGLHQDMLPIAHLESNFGRNTQHAAHSKGEYHTAVGAVGMKPVTAHEEYKKSKAIQKAFPGLEEPTDFINRMKSDNRLYNLLATSHFLRLKARHGSPERAAFAWRWGTGAAQNASEEQVASDPYVQKYVQIANKLKAKQALALKSEQNIWGTPIEKAVNPKDFKSIVRASTPEGKNYVDHTLHLNEHPEEHRDWVSGYRNEILGSPKVYKKLKKAQDGITKKVILTQNTPTGDAEKFMVKPYHERVIKRIQGWQKFPVQGWAEMTNQALYHAGEIGHLHQKVHVSEHNMGENNQAEPALVVRLEKGFTPIWKKMSESTQDVYDKFSRKTKQDALKIGLMDFLTNNLDRHGGNLMMADNGDLKAIDHSRSFQYVNNPNHKWEGRKTLKGIHNLEDKISPYIVGSDTSVGVFVQRPINYKERMDLLQDHAAPVFDWWGRVGNNVRDTMHKHLEAIKNPEVRAHIKRNFDARADWLDERAKFGIENYGEDWYNDPVTQYHPHQKTEEEVEQEKIKSVREQWQKEGE